MAQSYPLKIGVVSYPVRYDTKPAGAISHYRATETERYPLILYEGSDHRQIGTCRVRRKSSGDLEVQDIDAAIAEFARGSFYGAFSADDSGTASLNEVLFVVKQT